MITFGAADMVIWNCNQTKILNLPNVFKDFYGKLISTHPSRTVTLDTIDDDDEDPDEVAAFLPIFLPIDRNYESKYLFQFVDKKRRVKRRTLQG